MKKAYFMAAVSILCWSTVATVSKLLLGSMNNFQLLWASSFFSALFLLLFNLCSKRLHKLKEYRPKDFLITALIALPSTLFYYLFYYAGTDQMPASQAFIINYLWPIMSIVFACLLLHEKMTVRKIAAVIISFAGVVIVTSGDIADIDHTMLVGALCCVLGAISYGLFTALNQKVDYDKSITMMIGYSLTFLITTVINWLRSDLFVPSGIQLLGFGWNGIFTMAIANTVWVLALKAGGTAKISNLAYMTPFLSLIWTSLILQERLSVNSVAGLLLIVLGIFIQLKKKDAVKLHKV